MYDKGFYNVQQSRFSDKKEGVLMRNPTTVVVSTTVMAGDLGANSWQSVQRRPFIEQSIFVELCPRGH
jgi:hypothetical protein